MRSKPQSAAELRALQRLMARAVMRPLTAEARMRPRWIDGSSTAKAAAKFIKPGPRLGSFERLEIYNRQYWFRIFDCLADDYPGVRALIGEKRFRNLAIAYLATHPSTRFTLRDLGRHFPDFILAEPRWTTPRTVLASTMARLEWSHIEAFDNEARPPLTPSDLSGPRPRKNPPPSATASHAPPTQLAAGRIPDRARRAHPSARRSQPRRRSRRPETPPPQCPLAEAGGHPSCRPPPPKYCLLQAIDPGAIQIVDALKIRLPARPGLANARPGSDRSRDR